MTTLEADSPLIFKPQPSGREEVMLGNIIVAEIAPAAMPGRHSHTFRIMLPEAGVTGFRPARDLGVARWQVHRLIGEWLNAAGLRPIG